jgi:enoyl-CoA hydratase/carnithine racemase
MPDLLVEKQGRTTVLTINRPERMNALGGTVMEDLTTAVAEFNADPTQRVAILTGAGEKAFSAGADLKEMAEGNGDSRRLPMSHNPDIGGLAASEKPIIAAVNGLAVAGGLEAAISCDIRIASENAYFGVFEVKRGFLAGVAVSILPRLLPYGTTMDLMLSGERMTAQQALGLGFVQAVTAPGELMDRALAKADMIAQNSLAAVMGTKAVLKFWRDAMLAEQQRYYEAVIARVLLSGDFLEGPKAFAQKREPTFSNGWPDPFER